MYTFSFTRVRLVRPCVSVCAWGERRVVARARVLVTECSPRLEVARPGAPLLIIVVPPVPPLPTPGQQAGGVVLATDRIRGVVGSGCAGGAIRRTRGEGRVGGGRSSGPPRRGEKGQREKAAAGRLHAPTPTTAHVAPVRHPIATRADFLPACLPARSLCPLARSLPRLAAC